MRTFYAYVRVSTVKQGEGVSLEAQREAIQAFADREEMGISEWFEEKQTAAKGGRPVFDRMIRALKAGKADGLIIHKIDRSARNFADWAKIGDLSDAGVDIHFATESLDFRTRGGRLTADIQAVIAADYVRNLREETIKGMYGRLRQGLYPCAAPLGYLDNGGGKPKTPDPERAHYVKEAFELYETGQYSLRSLLTEMQRRGFRGRDGKPIRKHALELMLSNPFYTGLIKLKSSGATFQGIHKPLISRSLFDRVQRVKSDKSGKKITRHRHLYRGLFKCARCERSMIPELQRGHVYYRCQTPRCKTRTIREEQLIEAIGEALAAAEVPPESMQWLIQEFRSWADGHDSGEAIATIDAQLANIRAKIDALTDALIEQLIDKDTFNRRKESLIQEEAFLLEQRSNRRQNAVSPDHLEKFLEHAKSLRSSHISGEPDERRSVAQIAFSNRLTDGENVYLKPQDWLHWLQELPTVPPCDPDRVTSRTSGPDFAKVVALLTAENVMLNSV